MAIKLGRSGSQGPPHQLSAWLQACYKESENMPALVWADIHSAFLATHNGQKKMFAPFFGGQMPGFARLTF